MATLGVGTQEEKENISNHFYKTGTAFFSFTGVAESPRCSNSSWHGAAPSTKCMAHLFTTARIACTWKTLQNAFKSSHNVKIAQSFKAIWKISHIRQ